MSEPKTIAFLKCYWATVRPDQQNNLVLAVKARTWGVPADKGHRLKHVDIGDAILFYGRKIGFFACIVDSHPFYDATAIWPDELYPHRVLMSEPRYVGKGGTFANVWHLLRDTQGRPFASEKAASRGISSTGGIFKKLTRSQSHALFAAFGYDVKDFRVSG